MTGNHRELESVAAAVPVSENHWRRTRRLALAVVFLWFVAAVLLPMASKYMEAVAVLAIPLGYYLGSQGGLIIVALLLLVVAIGQNRIDRSTGQSD